MMARLLTTNWQSHLTSAKRAPIELDTLRPVTKSAAPSQHEQALGGTDMKFRPLHDRVVVARIDAESKTAGGIIIPDTAKREAHRGRGDCRPSRWPRRKPQACSDRPQRGRS